MNKFIYIFILQISLLAQCCYFKNELPVSVITLTAAGLTALHYQLKIRCFDKKHEEFKNYFTKYENNSSLEITEQKKLATNMKYPIKGCYIDEHFVFFGLRDSDVFKKTAEEFKYMEHPALTEALQMLVNNKKQSIDTQKKDFDVYKKSPKNYRNIGLVICLLSFSHLIYKIQKNCCSA